MNPSARSLNLVSRIRGGVGRMRDYWTLSPLETGLVLLVAFAFGYFFASGSWNQNARLDAIYAFVEPGPDQYTFRINRFVFDPGRNMNTGDFAVFQSNYYANKAPGTILLGVLVYWPLHWFETTVLGFDPYHPVLEIANAYFINFGVSVAFSALAILMYWRLLALLGVAGRRRLLVTLFVAFGTALFPYSTTLWGTATTTALVVGGYLGLRIGTPRSVAASGASLGFAVCSDYLALLFVLTAGVYVLLRRRARVVGFCLGGVPSLLILLGYHQYCFGSPFTTASSLSQPGFLDPSRWLGLLGWPAPSALYQISFGPMRGVFFQMPVLLLAPVGFWYWFRRKGTDPFLWLCAASFLLLLTIVSGFNGWHGGASVSARYLVPALPWLALSLKELPGSRNWTTTLLALGVLSAFNMFAVAATSSLAPENIAEPLYSWVYPEFFSGHLAAQAEPTRLQVLHPAWRAIAPLTCFNMGEVIGLSGFASLLPWFAVCIPLVGYLYRRADSESRSVTRQDQGGVGSD